jgi:hypothetical protein
MIKLAHVERSKREQLQLLLNDGQDDEDEKSMPDFKNSLKQGFNDLSQDV